MLSTFPMTFPMTFPTDPMFRNSYSTFEGGFTPWESPQPYPDPKAGSDLPQPAKPVDSSSGSADTKHSNIDQTDSNRINSAMDVRKLRRMISNRESARRSRVRKQKQLESLRNQLNRLRLKKVEISNRLRYALINCHCVRTENEWLQSEHRMLRQKLLDIRQILYFRQLQQFSDQFQPIFSDQYHPIIT